MPKFSILVPIIKGNFLSIAIESVINQNFSDWELVLYNDCSPDNIDVIVEKYKNAKIKYFKGEKNIGADDPSKTWNKVLEMASGEYVCLLGDDDFISENYLEEVNNLILKYPKTSLFRVGLNRVNEESEIISKGDNLPEFETWDQFLCERNVKKRIQSTSEFVINKESLTKVGGYVNFPRACGSDDVTYLLISREGGVVSTNKACAYWRKSLLNISDNDSKELNEHKVRFFLRWERDFLDKNFSLKIPLSELYKSIDDYLELYQKERREVELVSANTQLALVNAHLESARLYSESTRSHLESTKLRLEIVEGRLNEVINSREWRMGMILQKIFKLLIPKGSLRRSISVVAWRFLKSINRIFFKILKKIKNDFLSYAGNVYYFFKPIKKRRINKKSKKIVYIGHSYHNKTKSTAFLIDYLKELYEVEIILDGSWRNNGEKYPDLSFIDKSYLGVIFFQNLPNNKILENIKNDNIIFFPMYDSVGLNYSFWENYRKLKIINFSRTLHEKLFKWGFDSMRVQYFPKPQEFIPGNKNEVFFWQRITRINIDTISKLFGKNDLKMHIHKAIDPNHQFQQPSAEQEKKYHITYSDWFDTREEMWDVIKQKGVYIAPRELEGIGQSFLEAMAMGKAVVAVNNPTMNEYIENGKNGYLFDLKNPQEIDFSNIEQVQKNTYQFMQNGYKKWEKEKSKIIEFIKKQ